MSHANRVMSGLHREVNRLKALLKAAGVTDTQWHQTSAEGEGEDNMATLPTLGTRGGLTTASSARDARVRKVLEMHRQRHRHRHNARQGSNNCKTVAYTVFLQGLERTVEGWSGHTLDPLLCCPLPAPPRRQGLSLPLVYAPVCVVCQAGIAGRPCMWIAVPRQHTHTPHSHSPDHSPHSR